MYIILKYVENRQNSTIDNENEKVSKNAPIENESQQ